MTEIPGTPPCYPIINQSEESQKPWIHHPKCTFKDSSLKIIMNFRSFENMPCLVLACPCNKSFSAPKETNKKKLIEICRSCLNSYYQKARNNKCWRKGNFYALSEDEMFGCHHRLDGHKFEQVLWAGEGQGVLVCCSPWGHKKSDMTEPLNWTEACWRQWLLRHSRCS